VRLSGTSLKPIRLSRIWGLPNAAEIMARFEVAFAESEIATYGLRRDPENGAEQRQLVNSPLDYLIDWTGTRPRTKAEDHAVAARRRDKQWPIDDFFDIERGSTTDIFEDLIKT
jgi:hypothetical protein